MLLSKAVAKNKLLDLHSLGLAQAMNATGSLNFGGGIHGRLHEIYTRGCSKRDSDISGSQGDDKDSRIRIRLLILKLPNGFVTLRSGGGTIELQCSQSLLLESLNHKSVHDQRLGVHHDTKGWLRRLENKRARIDAIQKMSSWFPYA
jgi:hypothetical protein